MAPGAATNPDDYLYRISGPSAGDCSAVGRQLGQSALTAARRCATIVA
jgi:hypothetical protein